MKNSDRNESPLTITDDATGTSQNSISAARGGSPSNAMAGISQNQSSTPQLSPYFPSSTNSQTANIQPVPASTQAVVRSQVQLHQMVSYQLAGQTVTMSTTTTTQATTSTSDCPAPVTQQMVMQADQSSPFVEDMAWAKNLFKDYQPGVMKNGGKLVVLMEIIEESLKQGEKILIFSQSLSTLSVIEEFLSKCDVPFYPGRVADPLKPARWAKNKSYFRLDGNTSAQERERLINRFNASENSDVLLFMLSTRAGCLGINLVGASRVVVFDASWNPCHDVQAVCRVYRYGQVKPVHIYRLISTGTMEKKIYDRQISKQGMANRIVDELNPEANFTKQEIMKLICEKEAASPAPDLAAAADQFSDPVLVRLCRQSTAWISKVPFKHDSLLVDKKELKLTRAEKREAKRGYEMEKRAAMQGSRYCPGVIQPVYNRMQQPFVPKPVYPGGSVTKQPPTPVVNCTHHQTPPHLPNSVLHLPLASLIRAGVAVPSLQAGTQGAQSVPRTSSTTMPAQSRGNQQTTSSKDDVVMIDLDELPSPTKPMQEPHQAHQSRSNNDLFRMARNAFPNISPGFIDLLLKQGNAQGSQAQNVHGSQASPRENTQAVDIQSESTDEKLASADNITSNSASAAENSTLRTLLTKSPTRVQPSIEEEVSAASNQPNDSVQEEKN